MAPRPARWLALIAMFKKIEPRIELLESRTLLSAADSVAVPITVPRYDHVVVVMEENHSYSQILGPSIDPPTALFPGTWLNMLQVPLLPTVDTYIRSLADHSAVFTNSHGIAHPSQPNYLALFSGSTQGVTSDATPRTTFSAPSLGGQLTAAGDSFVGYSEGLPHAGYTGNDVGEYVRHHNPWVNFADVPAASNRSLARFRNFSNLPTVSFVIPNIDHDMHSGSVRTGDQWLQSHIGSYAKWARKHNSLLIVEWDEDNGTPSNHVATIFAGAHIRAGHYNEPVDDYRILNTIENMYGLTPLGQAAQKTPITDVFQG